MSSVTFDNPQELREVLFTVLESLPHGILLADRSGQPMFLNRKARSLLNLTGSSIAQHSCWEIVGAAFALSAEQLQILQQTGGKVLCQGGDAGGSGNRPEIAISRNELHSPFVNVAGFFLALDDVTFLTLEQSQSDRRKRFGAMREMAVQISQDLKNPLGSMELYASILKRELTGDPDNERVVAGMIQAVRTMDYLLNNYTTFASLPEPRLEPLSVQGWLDSALQELSLLFEQGTVRFSCQYAHREDCLLGDPKLLHQLALNLGLNGGQSMAEGGEVVFETRTIPAVGKRSQMLEVRVLDQGEGIAPEHVKQIFDPFFTTRDKANGLGLSIVHHVAEGHHGLVRVESEPGNGSVFTVLLPTA